MIEQLYKKYRKPYIEMAQIAYGFNLEDAKDLVQDFFLKLLEKGLPELEHEELEAFTMTSFKNFTVDRLRRGQSGYEELDNLGDIEEEFDESVNLNRAKLNVLVESLPEEDREVINYYLDGESARKIASLQGLHHQTVSNKIKVFITKAKKHFNAA